ncbi:hypothetical protein SISNIDRAFT_469137 [Sistotremastrum niveocremeum HHB9708]|uniref:Uncharacterized protein n=1 Tax=Sistotremastrum niveocremeum HHB9708 TaxID=1314777 RepID=A0A164QFX8_9AGAM|nr:hypothetical protein SISNIDRAFT_469137 [Sistotremastrum niveocremeum HHB9708]
MSLLQTSATCILQPLLEGEASDLASEILSPGGSLRMQVIAPLLENGEVPNQRFEYARVPDRSAVSSFMASHRLPDEIPYRMSMLKCGFASFMQLILDTGYPRSSSPPLSRLSLHPDSTEEI